MGLAFADLRIAAFNRTSSGLEGTFLVGWILRKSFQEVPVLVSRERLPKESGWKHEVLLKLSRQMGYPGIF
jgi:hypothetical protein